MSKYLLYLPLLQHKTLWYFLQFDDQGIVNSDSRMIAVPHDYANFIPTDIRGLTFARTPQQVLNIIFLGNPEAKGTFFPNGVLGRLDKPAGFDALATGVENFPIWPKKAPQVYWLTSLVRHLHDASAVLLLSSRHKVVLDILVVKIVCWSLCPML